MAVAAILKGRVVDSAWLETEKAARLSYIQATAESLRRTKEYVAAQVLSNAFAGHLKINSKSLEDVLIDIHKQTDRRGMRIKLKPTMLLRGTA